MSDNESSASENAPSDAHLEQTLRDVVGKIYESGNLDELTVKRVRAATESELDLEDGFFKVGRWKAKSKIIIENEAVSFVKDEIT
jgi:hypothetical protein